MFSAVGLRAVEGLLVTMQGPQTLEVRWMAVLDTGCAC